MDINNKLQNIILKKIFVLYTTIYNYNKLFGPRRSQTIANITDDSLLKWNICLAKKNVVLKD